MCWDPKSWIAKALALSYCKNVANSRILWRSLIEVNSEPTLNGLLETTKWLTGKEHTLETSPIDVQTSQWWRVDEEQLVHHRLPHPFNLTVRVKVASYTCPWIWRNVEVEATYGTCIACLLTVLKLDLSIENSTTHLKCCRAIIKIKVFMVSGDNLHMRSGRKDLEKFHSSISEAYLLDWSWGYFQV